MNNVLITGATGFVGNNLCNLLSNESEIKIFKGTRSTIDLYSSESTENFIDKNEINTIIHCAIEGGRRNKQDSPDIVYKNLLMFENLFCSIPKNTTFINIGSGAEFDRRTSIENKVEHEVSIKVPIDYYGLSKNIITKRLLPYNKTVTLRLFGCFYYNETPERFIRSNIERYIRGEPMIIHQDRLVDFFYMEDLATVIKYYIHKSYKYQLEWFERNVNMIYKDHLKLSDIANIINSLSNKKVDIIIEDKSMGNSYIGDSYGLPIISGGLLLKGLTTGIKECYDKLK